MATRYCHQMRELEINRGGRVLRVRDTGAPSGAVVMYFHGTPGSRLDLCFGEQLAAECGVRLISFDRPGYGGSTPAPFGLASIAADAHAVADEVGVARFATLGMSGGGPGALAAATVPGGRVIRAGVASGPGPFRLVPGALDELDDNDRGATALLPDDPAGAASAFAAGFEPLAELSRMPGGAGLVSAFEDLLSPRDSELLHEQRYASLFAETMREAAPGDRVNIAFLGGEPLTNRDVLVAATEFASTLARSQARAGRLLHHDQRHAADPDDGALFERHGFAVTVSLDGVGEVHDRLRPFKGGRGSFDRIIDRVRPLLPRQQRMQISARVTVTPRNLRLRETLDGLIALGFHSVGFSPMLASPTGQDQMDAAGLGEMLAQMIDCGQAFEANVLPGRRYPFANMADALREIDKGTHRPYPCGAGGGYLGVSAEGELFACHRFVGDEKGAMGDIASGIDTRRRQEWLRRRHVHFRNRATGAGRDTCAAADATTRSSSADDPRATTSAAGSLLPAAPMSGCRRSGLSCSVRPRRLRPVRSR